MSIALNHVLIIDPNESSRIEVRRLLSESRLAPNRITELSSADEGLLLCKAPVDQRPHIVLLALEVVGEQGNEWLDAARGSNEIFTTPVILLGEDEDDMRIDVALAAGAHEFLRRTGLSLCRFSRALDMVLVRHQLLQQMADREAYFHTMINDAPVLVWVSDTTKQCTFFNKIWLEFTGRTTEQEYGFGWAQGVHPDDYDRCVEIYVCAFDQRQQFEMEYRLRRHDGVYRWVLDRGTPQYSLDGTFIGYIGSCTDITENKAAEDELRTIAERLNLVLQGSSISVATLDQEMRYTWVNNPQSQVPVENILGKRDDEFLPPKTAQKMYDFKQEVLATGGKLQRQLELEFEGHTEHLDIKAEPIYDKEGNIAGLTLITINVTSRIRDEERTAFLAEASHVLGSSLHYETTLQQVADSMVPKLADWCSVDLITARGEIEQVAVAHVDPNKVKWAKSLRKNQPTAMDDPSGLAYVIRTGQSEFYPYIPQELLAASAQTPEQKEVLDSIGFKSVLIVPLITRSQILGAITLVWSDSDRHYDLDDLAFAEELARRAATAVDHARLYQETQMNARELQSLNETLEQRVEERTKELQRSNQDLDQFAYVASHDLKAPLRAIDHLSTWVLEDAGHVLPQRSQEHLQKMRGRIKRMEGLLDDLLNYSRAGRYRGEATSVDVNELVMRVIETVSLPESMTISIEGELPTLYSYAAPLETVLRNLVSNAIKHHDKPSGTVRISSAVKGEMVEFKVTDDGPGIDPMFHERIFQMFQTLRPRDQIEGSGMGLAVVQKIIESVGGRISVESELGHGATFYFTWPRHFVN